MSSVAQAGTEQGVTGFPQGLTREHNVELRSATPSRVLRYAVLVLLTAIVLLGLANAFGQTSTSWTASGNGATLVLTAPAHLRSGLLYQARFTIHARRKIAHAVLVFDRGWNNGQTINTIEPSPVAQTSHDGRMALTLGTIDAGSDYTVWLELQVNPTNIGLHHLDAVLYDGDTRLLRLRRGLTVFP